MSENYYCKWCGFHQTSIANVVNNRCSHNPNGKNHELYEGKEKSQYVCKYCGYKMGTIANLTNNVCSKSPNKRHHPAI